MHDSIYEPAEDSFLLKKHIENYEFKTALDIGCGSGVITEELSKHGKATGVDINPEAIKHCKDKKIDANFFKSDLFSNVKSKFDLITFNAPYLPQDEGIEDVALYGGEKGYETIEAFLKKAKKYLNEGGKILLIFTSLSQPEQIFRILEREGYVYELVDKEHYFHEDIFLYELK